MCVFFLSFFFFILFEFSSTQYRVFDKIFDIKIRKTTRCFWIYWCIQSRTKSKKPKHRWNTKAPGVSVCIHMIFRKLCVRMFKMHEIYRMCCVHRVHYPYTRISLNIGVSIRCSGSVIQLLVHSRCNNDNGSDIFVPSPSAGFPTFLYANENVRWQRWEVDNFIPYVEQNTNY